MAYTFFPTGGYRTNITAAGSANTKGSYTELCSSTPYDSSRIWLGLTGSELNASRYFLVDIATGAAASEVVLVNNLFIHAGTDFLANAFFPLDVDIPAGTRISARCQSPSASAQAPVWLLVEDRALDSLPNPVTYGAVTASSRGTQIDPGASADTKGAYTELTASTTADIDNLLIMFGVGTSQTEAIAAFTLWQVDIATGGSGAETVVIPDIVVQSSPTIDSPRPPVMSLPVSIPSGTRIAARARCSTNDAGDRLIAVLVVGMQVPTEDTPPAEDVDNTISRGMIGRFTIT